MAGLYQPKFHTHRVAERPNDPGLDIVFIHGIRTLSLPELSSGWEDVLLKASPPNSRLLGYDVGMNAQEEFSWGLIEESTMTLLTALDTEFQTEAGSQVRSMVFIGYALGGLVLKHLLSTSSQQDVFERYSKDTRGVIFLATPHMSASSEAARILGGIIRHAPTWSRKTALDTDDLIPFQNSAMKYEELRLQCPILSCFESVQMMVRSRLFKRPVQMVSRTLAITSAENEKLHEIDTKLIDVFHSTDCTIHTHIRVFMTEILTRNDEAHALRIRANAMRHGMPNSPPSSCASHMRIDISSPSSPVSSSSQSGQPTPQSSDDTAEPSPSRRFLIPNGASDERTPSSSSRSASSDMSYVFIFRGEDIEVPDKVKYMQTMCYETPNQDFVGRIDVTTEMNQHLLPRSARRTRQQPAVYTLCGPAGIGKTQTALNFFHSQNAAFDVTLWIQANSTESLFDAFSQVSIELELQAADKARKDPILSRQLVIEWLRKPVKDSTTRQKQYMKWLMVFDNVDEPNVLNEFWPLNAPGSILITTRDPILRTKTYWGEDGCTLSALPDNDAVSLFKQRLPKHLWEADPIMVQTVRALSLWPIAIVQMAGNMARLSQTPSRFLQRYSSECHRAEYFERMHGPQNGYMIAVASLWPLTHAESNEARLLCIISLLSPNSIPEEVLTKAPEVTGLSGYPLISSDYDWAISNLEKASILSRTISPTTESYSQITIHSFIQEVVRSQLLKHEDRFVEVFNAAITLLTTVWPFETLPFYKYYEFDSANRWIRCDRILPHIGHLRHTYTLLSRGTQRRCATEDFLNILSEAGWYHYSRSNFDDSLDYVKETLRVHELCETDYPRIVAGQYGTWSSVAMALNQATVAREKGMKALQIRKAIFTSEQLITSQLVASYTELSRAMIMCGELEEARELIDESVRLRREMPNFSKLQLHSPRLYLSLIFLLKDQYDEAEIQLKDVLSDREAAYGKDDQEGKRTGIILLILGSILEKAGRFAEAYEYHRRAFDQLRAVAGESDFDTARACYKLAMHHLRQKTLNIAQTLIDQAVNVFGRSKYHECEHARALYLKGKILDELGEFHSRDIAFAESEGIREKLSRSGPCSAASLKLEDFDELIPIWFR